MSSWSEPQSPLGLIFADSVELLHFFCKEYNQSDFNIDHLVISMCRVISWVVGKGSLLWPACSLDKTHVSLCPASFCNSRPNLPVILGIFLTSYFHIPTSYDEKNIFFFFFLVLVLESLVGLHRTIQLQLLWHQWLGHRLGLLWCWMVCLGNELKSFWVFFCCCFVFEIVPTYCILDSLVDSKGYSISSKEFLPTVVDIMVIWIKFTHSYSF